MKKTILFLFTLLLSLNSFSQQTGIFNDFLDFNGQSRAVSVFVPNDYDATNEYQLIVGLHGLGDNSNNYLNALVNYLNFQSAFPNTILVCPNGDPDFNGLFYSENNGEYIIDTAINYALSNYNIDQTKIILQGFSLGAESALRFGLTYPDKFKGLILNTPAIQGVLVASNESTNYTFNYQNADQIPMVITLGNQDLNYLEPINIAVSKLAENNGKFEYNIFTGDHSVPSFLNYDYNDFFETPYSPGFDASLYLLNIPYRACNGTVTTEILVQNTGNQSIESIDFTYGINSDLDTFQWQGLIDIHESITISLPEYDVSELSNNHYNFKVNIASLNESETDDFTAFNQIENYFHVANETFTIPFDEDFNNSAALSEWAYDFSGDYIFPFEWDEIDEGFYTFNTIFVFDNRGTSESIISPIFDIPSTIAESGLNLSFDIEYNYTEYTSAVLGMDTIFADTLEVLITTDCGVTYETIFKKGGADLSAYESPILNPLNFDPFLHYKDEEYIQTFTVDISNYIGVENVAFKLKYISDLGGYIIIDGFRINDYPVSIDENEYSSMVNIYPNPAKDKINITSGNENISNIKVFNILGQLVYSNSFHNINQAMIQVSDWTKGQYFFNIQTDKRNIKKKILIY